MPSISLLAGNVFVLGCRKKKNPKTLKKSHPQIKGNLNPILIVAVSPLLIM